MSASIYHMPVKQPVPYNPKVATARHIMRLCKNDRVLLFLAARFALGRVDVYARNKNDHQLAADSLLIAFMAIGAMLDGPWAEEASA